MDKLKCFYKIYRYSQFRYNHHFNLFFNGRMAIFHELAKLQYLILLWFKKNLRFLHTHIIWPLFSIMHTDCSLPIQILFQTFEKIIDYKFVRSPFFRKNIFMDRICSVLGIDSLEFKLDKVVAKSLLEFIDKLFHTWFQTCMRTKIFKLAFEIVYLN